MLVRPRSSHARNGTTAADPKAGPSNPHPRQALLRALALLFAACPGDGLLQGLARFIDAIKTLQQVGPRAGLQDAVKRAAAVAENAGVRTLLVHAPSSRARSFYEGCGFQLSPAHPMTLMLRLPARS
jgi:hypothetical protein